MARRSCVGNCDKCGKEFSGFGGTCSDCRKAGSSGNFVACSQCGDYFQGFGGLCSECLERQIGSFGAPALQEEEEDEGAEHAPLLMKRELREHMAGILLAAVRSGKLDEAATTVSMLAQREARGSVIKWDKMGSALLGQAKDKPAATTVDELVARAQRVLLEACMNGTLEGAASGLPPPSTDDDRSARPDGPLKKKVSRLFE